MTKKVYKRLSAGTYNLTATAAGYSRYTARFRVSSAGAVSCVSVSGGSCSAFKRPGMSASGKSVVVYMKSGSTGGTCSTTADFGYAVSGKTVRFTDRSKTSSGCSIRDRYWLFGDGDEEFSSNPTHTFPAYNKSYNVSLKVTDSKGNQKTVRKTIKTGSSSGGGSTKLVCATTANFSYTVSGKTVSFRDTSRTSRTSGSGSCTIKSRYWLFGDGDEEFSSSPRHMFPSYDRSYNVSLKVTDSAGNQKTIRKSVRTGSSSSGGGGGGGTTTDWDTETKSLAAGADHTIRVSHGDYDMLTMKIRISSSGAVSCLSVDSASSKCNRSTPPGITVSGSAITAWMNKSSSGSGGGGGDGVCGYITSIGGKDSIEWTRDVLGSYYKFIGLKDTVNYDPSWNDVLTVYYYFIGLDSRAEGLTHCGF